MFKLSDWVFNRCEKIGFNKLNRPEQVFFCVWWLEAEVNNGGFDQYYFNSAGDHAIEAVTSLEAIGANHTADLVKQANALFGPAGPSPIRATRQNQLDALREAKPKKLDEIDEEFLSYKDNSEQLLEQFVSKNAEAFRQSD
jgi:hypothetical protein